MDTTSGEQPAEVELVVGAPAVMVVGAVVIVVTAAVVAVSHGSLEAALRTTVRI
jgi:hypothetical protein